MLRANNMSGNLFNDFFTGKDCAKEIDYGVNDDGNLEVFFEFPGVKKEDLDIKTEGQTIIVEGKKITGKKEKNIKEAVTVSKQYDVETLKAKHVDGLLTITIFKTEKKKNKFLID